MKIDESRRDELVRKLREPLDYSIRGSLMGDVSEELAGIEFLKLFKEQLAGFECIITYIPAIMEFHFIMKVRERVEITDIWADLVVFDGAIFSKYKDVFESAMESAIREMHYQVVAIQQNGPLNHMQYTYHGGIWRREVWQMRGLLARERKLLVGVHIYEDMPNGTFI